MIKVKIRLRRVLSQANLTLAVFLDPVVIAYHTIAESVSMRLCRQRYNFVVFVKMWLKNPELKCRLSYHDTD